MCRIVRWLHLCGIARTLAVLLLAAPVSAAAGALGPSPDATLKVLEVAPDIGHPENPDQPVAPGAIKSKDTPASPRGLDLGEGVLLSPGLATSSTHEIVDPNKKRVREPWLKLTIPLSK